MMNKCEKAESGEHEPDMERLKYEAHVGSNAAVYATKCLHCGTGAKATIFFDEFNWQDFEEFTARN